MLLIRFVCLFLAPGWLFAADVLSAPDAAKFLERTTRAAREMNYQGVYIDQRSGITQTYRLSHMLDEGVELERRESLDGPAREMVRRGHSVSVYFAGSQRQPVFDQRQLDRLFPGVGYDCLASIQRNYQLRRIGSDRIAGLDAEAWALEPRDNSRYPARIWVHVPSGLLLKVALQVAPNESHEVFAFSQVQVGGTIERKYLQSPNPLRQLPDDAPLPDPAKSKLAERWNIRELPPGFRLIKQSQRIWAGYKHPADHLLYNDGLVTVSVFLEPMQPHMPVGLAHQGIVHIYGREVDGKHVLVLGSIPSETAVSFARAYSPK